MSVDPTRSTQCLVDLPQRFAFRIVFSQCQDPSHLPQLDQKSFFAACLSVLDIGQGRVEMLVSNAADAVNLEPGRMY